jgi:hypothetical protein
MPKIDLSCISKKNNISIQLPKQQVKKIPEISNNKICKML